MFLCGWLVRTLGFAMRGVGCFRFDKVGREAYQYTDTISGLRE